MRIRLNTTTDELWIELSGETGKLEDMPEPMRTIDVPGEDGRAAFIEIDADGYVRMVRVARLAEIVAEFSPQAAVAAGGKGKKPLTSEDIARRTRAGAAVKP